MTRKTIEVAEIIRKANGVLAAPGSTVEGREAVSCILESILHETGNYSGYRYLELKISATGTVETLGCGSRREYFIK
jgi:hypothetical protein